MSIEVVVGVNWGDEGKGRMVDYLARSADVVVRFQGGSNAGHTVVNEYGTFKLHLIPSGIFWPRVTNVLGPGMVVDPEALAGELIDLQGKGVTVADLKISDRATICFPFHRQEDAWEEERLGQGRMYGSTRQGVAPAYGDRYLKKAIQLGELLHPARLKSRLRDLVEWKDLVARGVYGNDQGVSFEETWDWVNTFGERIKPAICDTSEFLENAAAAGKKVLFEGQLGALRDVCFGIYPYTTSSCTLAAFASIGGGLFGYHPSRVIGVMKAFSTCVGEGPFVTEMPASQAKALRETAFEFGAATGRPRRIGHFDAVASRYGVRLQGATDLALTKLDSLSGRDRLLICTVYEIDGNLTDRFPLNAWLDLARPVYQEMEGWREDISCVRRFTDLPKAAQAYVVAIERLMQCPIRFISVGPERDCLIER